MEIGFTNLLIVSALAFTAPFVLGLAPSVRLPAVVLRESREKNSDSRMIVAKSAIVAPAMTSWPNAEPASPRSLSTGMTMPSDVALSAIATKTTSSTMPIAFRPPQTTSASAKLIAKPALATRSARPRS